MAAADLIREARVRHDAASLDAEWEWWQSCGWEYAQARREAVRVAGERRAAACARRRRVLVNVGLLVGGFVVWVGPVVVAATR